MRHELTPQHNLCSFDWEMSISLMLQIEARLIQGQLGLLSLGGR